MLGAALAAAAVFAFHATSAGPRAGVEPQAAPQAVSSGSDPSLVLAALTAAIAWDTMPVSVDAGASIAAYGD